MSAEAGPVIAIDHDPELDEPGHGHSRAAWTSVIVMLVAIAAGTVFFFFDMPMYVLACAGLLLVGIILWPIVAKLSPASKGH